MSEILTDFDVDFLEEIVGADTKGAVNRNFLRLIVSHRLLSARVKELEKKREFWQDRARGLVEKARNVGGT